jgi:hypothetical protein
MAHFALIENGIVQQVIVAEQEFIDTLHNAPAWIQTSYNTKGGVHMLGGTPLRKNYAGIGFAYDPERDAFIPPKEYPSWVLDEASCTWRPPVPAPQNGQKYSWDESSVSWTLVTD